MRIGIITVIAIAALIGSSGYYAGSYVKEKNLRSTGVKYGCAFYDMETGDFRWGVAPIMAANIEAPEPPAIATSIFTPKNWLKKKNAGHDYAVKSSKAYGGIQISHPAPEETPIPEHKPESHD